MKILNAIYKILASVCMVLFISFIGMTILWMTFDSNRQWMIIMPIWLRFAYLIILIGMSSFMTYTEYIRYRKSN